MQRPSPGGTLLMLFFASAAAACVVLAGPSLMRWHRESLAADLGEKLPQLNSREVGRAIEQLAAFGPAATGELVEAAASPRAVVAKSARQALSQMLAAWRLRLENQNIAEAEAVAGLIVELEENVDRFSPIGKQWAERTVIELIELANLLPPRESALVLSLSSEVLARVPPQGPRLRNLPSLAPGEPERPLAVPPVTEFTAGLIPPTTPRAPADASGEHRRAARSPGAIGAAPTVPGKPPLVWGPRRKGPNAVEFPGEAQQRRPRLEEPVSQQPPVASRPPRAVPATPGELLSVPTPAEMLATETRLRRLPTHELVSLLQEANYVEAAQLRRVLRERGITEQQLQSVSDLFSLDAKKRAAAVSRLGVWPAIEARSWLRRLLSDPSAEVRVRALTQLAVSNDPRVLYLARELSQNDPDRRVADAADRILDTVRR